MPFLIRTRAFLGASEYFGFLGGAIEIEDARLANSQFAPDATTANHMEPISAYVELKFKRLLRKDVGSNHRPVMLRAGRMNFEMIDRRLIGNNYWRNTTNTFQGLRAAVGNDHNDWSLDLLALQPLARVVNQLDTGFRGQIMYGAIGHWRKWSHIITIEPYYLMLHQSPNHTNHQQERKLHNAALRVYGFLPGKKWNYDFGVFQQFGRDSTLQHRANAYVAEIGYFLRKNKYAPRISAFFGYASGDQNPNDGASNRFFRFYGFGRPWHSADYIVMENIIAPKLRLEAKPAKRWKFDFSYCHYWLASSTDRMSTLLAGSSFNRDASGKSGNYIGNGFDLRILFTPIQPLLFNVVYSYFQNGEFIRNRETAANSLSAPHSHFIYFEVLFNMIDAVSLKKSR